MPALTREEIVRVLYVLHQQVVALDESVRRDALLVLEGVVHQLQVQGGQVVHLGLVPIQIHLDQLEARNGGVNDEWFVA
jgi:hypothetical protein